MSYGTRTNDGLYAEHVKSDLGKTSISYRGPLIWNMIINTGINTDVSEAVFTKSLKKRIMNGSLLVLIVIHLVTTVLSYVIFYELNVQS